MITENLQRYAYFLMFVNLAVMVINIGGFFPIHYTIAGYDVMESIVNDVDSIVSGFENAGNSLEYLLVAGFAIINGIQIIIKFLLLVLAGLAGIAAMMGIPAIIYTPIVVAVDAIILYDFAKMLLKLG